MPVRRPTERERERERTRGLQGLLAALAPEQSKAEREREGQAIRRSEQAEVVSL